MPINYFIYYTSVKKEKFLRHSDGLVCRKKKIGWLQIID